MTCKVFLHPDVHAFIQSLDEKSQRIVKNKLRTLREEPYKRGKKLASTRFFRLKLTDNLRAIYEIVEKEGKVIVLVVDYRRNIYDDFRRLL